MQRMSISEYLFILILLILNSKLADRHHSVFILLSNCSHSFLWISQMATSGAEKLNWCKNVFYFGHLRLDPKANQSL